MVARSVFRGSSGSGPGLPTPLASHVTLRSPPCRADAGRYGTAEPKSTRLSTNRPQPSTFVDKSTVGTARCGSPGASLRAAAQAGFGGSDRDSAPSIAAEPDGSRRRLGRRRRGPRPRVRAAEADRAARRADRPQDRGLLEQDLFIGQGALEDRAEASSPTWVGPGRTSDEARAGLVDRGHREIPAHRPGEIVGDGQAEPGAAHGAWASTRRTVRRSARGRRRRSPAHRRARPGSRRRHRSSRPARRGRLPE